MYISQVYIKNLIIIDYCPKCSGLSHSVTIPNFEDIDMPNTIEFMCGTCNNTWDRKPNILVLNKNIKTGRIFE